MVAHAAERMDGVRSAGVVSLREMSRPSPRFIACTAVLLLLAAGCGTATIAVSRVQKADVKVLPGGEGFTNPLTGAAAHTPQDWQTRRPLAIKIGNSVPERPQAGLDRADLVYEEIVEGGVTRFMAVFLTNQSPRVGPVRSVRTVDHKILQPLGALFGYSGGVPPVIEELRETPGVTDVGADVVGGAYRRDSNRDAPYNLYSATDRLWTGRDGTPPGPQFAFLSSDEDRATDGQETANDVKLSFSSRSQVRYVFDEKLGLYERYDGDEPHLVEGPGDGVHLAFTNVLIQMVSVSAGSTVDRSGELSRDIRMLGRGSAVLFRGGKAIRGTWQREGIEDVTTFVASSGEPLRLAPGTTIVELIPQGQEMFVS